jgi:hypothetical protein
VKASVAALSMARRAWSNWVRSERRKSQRLPLEAVLPETPGSVIFDVGAIPA